MSELLQIIQKLLKTSPRAARRVEQFADEIPGATQQFSPNAISEAAQDLRTPISPLKPQLFEKYAFPLNREAQRDIRAGRSEKWNELQHLMEDGAPQFDDIPRLGIKADPIFSGAEKSFGTPQIFMHDGRHRMRMLGGEFDTSAVRLPVSQDVLGEAKGATDERLDAAIKWLNEQKSFLNEAADEHRAYSKPQPNVFKPFADGGTAHFEYGGHLTEEEIASMTHERSTPAAPPPTFADAARSIQDIVTDHYKKQALGLARDPLGTASRNVRTVTEMALPVSTLYKAADVATGAEGAEAPDAWDVVGDIGALTGYKAGREALKVAAPAAVAGIVMTPTDAEANPLKDALKAGRAAVDTRLPKGTFSPAARAIETAPQDMTGAQWKNYLRGRQVDVGGQKFPVRPDELEFTGMGELLDQYGEKRVSRGALLDFLSGSKLESYPPPLSFDEVDTLAYLRNVPPRTSGGRARLAELEANEKAALSFKSRGLEDRGAVYPYETQLADNQREFPTAIGNTQYGEHKLPGPSERYSEELTRMPGLDYKAPHFGSVGPETISHSRMSTRELPEGSKAVHIDEIQSDLHQKARDEGGYRGNLPAGTRIEKSRDGYNGYDVIASDGTPLASGPTPDVALQRFHSARTHLPPRAPYEDRYHEVEFNKALRRAVDEDADRVTWTTGQQQAQRWDQQIQGGVKKLELVSGPFPALRVTTPDGATQVLRQQQPGKYATSAGEATLQDLVGNSLAKKLEKEGVLEGDNLSLGGGGFKNFYDGTINKYAESWARRFPGAKVEPAQLPGVESTNSDIARAIGLLHFQDRDTAAQLDNLDTLQTMLGAIRNRVPVNQASAEARQVLLDSGVTKQDADTLIGTALNASQTRNLNTVHSLKLTPEMKAWVKQHGTPIMSVAPAAAVPMMNDNVEHKADGGTVLSRIEALLQ